MKNDSIAARDREAYWQETRAELKSIERRGEIQVFVGVGVLCGLLALYHEPWERVTAWTIFWASLSLTVISSSLWFVITRKRRIAVARGLVCNRCHYVPHDTQITEVAETRQCPRCESSLDD